MTNYTILERNTLDGFEYEDTKELYLRGAARGELKAFKCACEWEDYLRNLCPIIEIAGNMHKYNPNVINTSENISEEVLNFIKERQFRRYFPDGRA